MQRFVLSPFFGAVALCASLGGFAIACGSSSSNNNPTNTTGGDGGSDASANAACDPGNGVTIDPANPPLPCGPTDFADGKCANVSAVSSCPQGSTGNGCMAQVPQSGNKIDLRMGRLQLYFPSSLQAVAGIAVDPAVKAFCDTSGTEQFNWVMHVDLDAKTITTGGAHASTDHKNFAFATDTVMGSSLDGICKGFGSGPNINLAPVSGNITVTGNSFTTDVINKVNVPIFAPGTSVPIILPLSQTKLQDVTLSADHSCVGSWNPLYSCGASKGWTTGGAVVGYITVAEADAVPVKDAGCQSLCALLVGDMSKTAKNAGGNAVCAKNADGSYPAIGDSDLAGGTKNAFRLSATFGAYGITITNVGATGGDAGATSDAASASDGASSD